ncbi:MGH1-like glycoside hydrolase domain-containing protein [Hymenobacter arizonensis]|uniref:Trehalase n=1 Tax=Hymenobacter arizonensis TaxID=1227077 RepID=A0A1I6BJ70_HYMAR|nr:trehalase family glycosidase [Hymenobacter arizonensis]SFQ80973.1 Trehalase [Hymenobacter arizonensis]
MSQRRTFLKSAGAAGLTALLSPLDACSAAPAAAETSAAAGSKPFVVSPELAQRMYDKALSIAKSKIRGGEKEPFFKKPYLDEAFSPNIFYWDTCFMACYAKYHQQELPIAQALDNFYRVQDEDGYIGREYTENGQPFWEKHHPVSINPPLLAFAELELHSQQPDVERLRRVYPNLKRHFDFLQRTYRGDDNLYFGDTLGMGMDNIPRYPAGWKDDGKGLPVKNLFPKIFQYRGTNASWNIQGRLVDFSSQMAFFALNLKRIAQLTSQAADVPAYEQAHAAIKQALNEHCWSEADGFYFDLGYGQPIRRFHVGMYWALLAECVPANRLNKFVAHLTDPKKFGRPVPVPSLAADEPEYKAYGDYWLGGVWAPTTYMVLRGLQHVGKAELAQQLAQRFYGVVAQVFQSSGTFWENYAPEFASYGNPAKPDFCGWTAIVPIAIWREFIKAKA